MGNQCGRAGDFKPYNPMLEPYSERICYTEDIEVPDIAQFWRNVLARADLPGICPSQLERIGKIIYERSSSSAHPHISMAEFTKVCAINHLVWFSDSELERFVSSTCLEFFQSDIQDKYAKESLMEITSLLAKCVPRSTISDNDAVMVPMESPSVRSITAAHFPFPKAEGEAGASDHDCLSVGSSVWSMGINSAPECLQKNLSENEGGFEPIKPDLVLRSKYTRIPLGNIPCCIRGNVCDNKNECLRTASF